MGVSNYYIRTNIREWGSPHVGFQACKETLDQGLYYKTFTAVIYGFS
jgi:hypothetical protein